jgi:hypothetical protein
MTVEESVQAVLVAADVSVSDDRIRLPGDWQALARPYIVHGPVAVQPVETHQGRATLTAWPYQVSCFGDTYSQARGVATAVIAVLGASANPKCFLNGMTPMYDDERNVHHIALDWDIWYE